jgi:hypothetical protein
MTDEIKVLIEVSGGVASIMHKTKGVVVILRDYDNKEDHDGNEIEYTEEIFNEDDELGVW